MRSCIFLEHTHNTNYSECVLVTFFCHVLFYIDNENKTQFLNFLSSRKNYKINCLQTTLKLLIQIKFIWKIVVRINLLKFVFLSEL